MRVTKSGGAQGSFSCSPRGSSRWQGVGSGCPPWSIASVRPAGQVNAAQSTTHCTCHATATATKVAMRGVECGLAMESTCIIGRSLRAENHFLTAGAAHERNVAKPERVSDNGNGAETHSGRRDHRAQQQTEKGYCQVEGFKADSTPRYGRRRILEPHDIGPRFANLTVPPVILQANPATLLLRRAASCFRIPARSTRPRLSRRRPPPKEWPRRCSGILRPQLRADPW